MSENSERKGMVWARWSEGLRWSDGAGELDDLKRAFDAAVEMRLDDERRALVRAAPQVVIANYITVRAPFDRLTEYAKCASNAANDWADAVLARYDEEVRGE